MSLPQAGQVQPPQGNSQNYDRDPVVTLRSIVLGQNKGGGIRHGLYLGYAKRKDGSYTDELGALIKELQAFHDQGLECKLELNTTRRVNSQTGIPFDSAYMFVKAVNNKQTNQPQKLGWNVEGGVTPVSTEAQQNATLNDLANKQV